MEKPSRLRSAPPRRNSDKVYKRRHLYVSSEDEKIWLEAETWAKTAGVSVSSLVADALDEYMQSKWRGDMAQKAATALIRNFKEEP
jgi:hypothetical protein